MLITCCSRNLPTVMIVYINSKLGAKVLYYAPSPQNPELIREGIFFYISVYSVSKQGSRKKI